VPAPGARYGVDVVQLRALACRPVRRQCRDAGGLAQGSAAGVTIAGFRAQGLIAQPEQGPLSILCMTSTRHGARTQRHSFAASAPRDRPSG
jgi:hypothetical protein